MPAQITRQAHVIDLASYVPLQLRIPVILVRSRLYAPTASGMLMPETAVYKDSQAFLSDYEIRFPRECIDMQSVPNPECRNNFRTTLSGAVFLLRILDIFQLLFREVSLSIYLL